MCNEEIIFKTAVASGLYSKAEAVAIIQRRGSLPLHTYQAWKQRGYQVKRGEKAALVATLWKYADKKVEVDGEEVECGSCHRTTAYLFTENQVEKAVTRTVKTREELIAYNKMLAEQRRAAKRA